MPRSLLSAVLSLSLLLSTLVVAQDASYTFTTIDVPGATTTSVSKINDRGQMVDPARDRVGVVEQEVDQRVVELGEKAEQRMSPAGRGQLIGTELAQASLGLFATQSVRGGSKLGQNRVCRASVGRDSLRGVRDDIHTVEFLRCVTA